MKNIEIKILNPEAISQSEKMMVCAARLTQRGHKIKNMADFMALYEKDYTYNTLLAMSKLPHPTIQKFGVINIVVVGASRRFLAQITRHQNEVKFMSASLQYSDYSGEADFVIPYELVGCPAAEDYLMQCKNAMTYYQKLVKDGNFVDIPSINDAAGYAAPQGLRNILIISATPYQWKHMISQRSCRRNTSETRYVMLKIWEELHRLAPELFANAGPFCMNGLCKEGKMSCGKPINETWGPAAILHADFPKLQEER